MKCLRRVLYKRVNKYGFRRQSLVGLSENTEKLIQQGMVLNKSVSDEFVTCYYVKTLVQ
jgi:hypothetical protein